ncbi:MAG TPA: cupredoxin domain-containing protein [Rhodocyclaceae bacterium]
MNFLPRLLLALSAASAMTAGVANAAELPTFRLSIKAGRFQPETVEVPANTKFRLLIKNEGPGPEEFESTELIKEKVLAEGVESFLIFQPLKPGSYAFFGEFHPDTAKGHIVAK